MTIREYLLKNQSKASYTIKLKKKEYLCNIFDSNSVFGERTIRNVTYRDGNKNLPIITVS